MPRSILMIGTFDSKGEEYHFLRNQLQEQGCEVRAVNAGTFGTTDLFPVDVEAEEVARAAGETIDSLRSPRDRGRAIEVMARGGAVVVRRLFDEGRFDGIIGMGGSGGTGIVTAAMRALPIGVPKVCISTLAAGEVSAFVGTKDIVMMPSIVDVAGINRILKTILVRGAGAVCGMARAALPSGGDERPLIAASMFGNTTQCVDLCRSLLDRHGYETLVFHATGTGGRILESLADEQLVDGVLDITTTEWADELCGGILSAGPERLDAPGRRGIPHLIVPGCLDMCNFGPARTVPDRYRQAGRQFYEWSPEITLMRTTPEENRRLGEIFARKANAARRAWIASTGRSADDGNRTPHGNDSGQAPHGGPVAFLLPLKGLSMLDADGERFCDREADQAFFDALKAHLEPEIPVVELEANINDERFAQAAVKMMLELMESD